MRGAQVGVVDRLRDWLAGPSLEKRDAALTALQSISEQRLGTASGSVSVTQESALRHSAVWASLRLRANLVSTLSIDTFRHVGDVDVEVSPPPFFDAPSGPDSYMDEWLWATQFDLDRYGLTSGVITERDGSDRPSRIDLVSAAEVVLRGSGSVLEEVQIGREKYTGARLRDVYLEHQYRPAGMLVGLCPIAAAAWSIGGYLSAQKFGLDYFGSGAMPSGVLKNTALEMNDAAVTSQVKARFKSATANRDVFVTGKDWEWTPADAPAAASAFLEAKSASVVEIARYLDVPADMIDGAVSGSSVTYASITQRNVQLLVMHLGPTIWRREKRLSRLLARPRFVKLNTDAILRMDPETRARVLNDGIKAFRITPTEARALDNRPALTEADYLEFERLGMTKQTPAQSGAPA
jgi:HK97 family phage portal protein